MTLDIRKLQSIIVEALDDIKARDIAVFDTTGASQEFDRVILATAEVSRQTRAMAMNVIDKVKAAGGRIVSMEGGDSGEWVLVDCVDAVVHIMQPAVRQYYNLEELWGQKRIKVSTMAELAKTRAAAVARQAADEAMALVARVKKAVATSQAVKNAVVEKVAVKKIAAKNLVATKAVVKKAVVKKVAVKKVAVKKVAVKKVVVKKVAVKKVAVKKVAVKKVAVKKVAVKNVAVKKVAVKKVAVKKVAMKKVALKKIAAKKRAPAKAPAKKSAAKKPAR